MQEGQFSHASASRQRAGGGVGLHKGLNVANQEAGHFVMVSFIINRRLCHWAHFGAQNYLLLPAFLPYFLKIVCVCWRYFLESQNISDE